MLRQRSLRFRLTVWYALILAAALGLFSALIWFSLQQRLLSETDRDLSDRAARFQSYLATESAEVSGDNLKDELDEFSQGLPSADFLDLRAANGFAFHFPGKRTPSGPARTVSRQFTIGRDSYELRIGTSLQAIDHTLDLLAYLLLGLVPLAIAIACIGGSWLSGRALRPVDEITDAARTIGIDNLSLRLPVSGTGDELQRLTETWNVMLARLEAAVQTLAQFAADASHELRAPLSVIRTSAELALRRGRSPESYRGSLREIADEAERMTQLVEDLLFLARQEAQSTEMPKAPLDLKELVREVVAEMRGIAEARAIRIGLTGLDSAALWISGNRPALRRLFLVLIDNALKYSRAAAEVQVSVAAAGGAATVWVRDFGVGIGSAELPHIFKRFYQADRAHADGGFGLGLSLADSIARAHGVAIEVESAEGCGSTFRVTFPAATRAAGGSRPAQTPDPLLNARR